MFLPLTWWSPGLLPTLEFKWERSQEIFKYFVFFEFGQCQPVFRKTRRIVQGTSFIKVHLSRNYLEETAVASTFSYQSRSNCLLWPTSRDINEFHPKVSRMSPFFFPNPKHVFSISQAFATCSSPPLPCNMLPPQLQKIKLDPSQWDVSVELAIEESIHSILVLLSDIVMTY